MRRQAQLRQESGTIQYTIRGVPADVDRALRQKATKSGLSLNQVIVDELTATTVGPRRKADFSGFAGKWVPDPAFDEIIASQRQIDWDKWK